MLDNSNIEFVYTEIAPDVYTYQTGSSTAGCPSILKFPHIKKRVVVGASRHEKVFSNSAKKRSVHVNEGESAVEISETLFENTAKVCIREGLEKKGIDVNQALENILTVAATLSVGEKKTNGKGSLLQELANAVEPLTEIIKYLNTVDGTVVDKQEALLL